MDRWIAALLAGLVGGVGGTLAVRQLFPEAGSAPLEAPAGDGGARLARLEASLAELNSRGPLLEAAPGAGSAKAGAAGTGATLLTSPEGEAFKKALLAEVNAKLDQRLEKLEAGGEEAGKPERARGPDKRRANLAEAARELELTAQQEDDLRRVYAASQDKMLRIVAGEGGDVEAVRREVEEASREPKKRTMLMAKYMPKVLPKIGEVIQVQLEQQAAVEAVVGPDKAARIEREFDLIEANPLGGGGEMRVNADIRNR